MYKFAVLPYANAAPMVHFIPELYPDAELIYRTPRNTLSELIEGNVDAAIIPVADYFDTPNLQIVEGLGICAKGDVESVLLQCETNLKNVRNIKLDKASKTSNLLLKVLFKNHFSIQHFVSFEEEIEDAGARVVIGDRALRAKPAFESYDLSGQWWEMAQLPFVFAVWVCRKGCPDSDKLAEVLHFAKQVGCNAIDFLSKLHSHRLGINQQRCYHYLTNCIHYDIGSAECAGMELFRKLSLDLRKDSKKSAQKIHTLDLKDTIDVKVQCQSA